jgi:hypothetical protein
MIHFRRTIPAAAVVAVLSLSLFGCSKKPDADGAPATPNTATEQVAAPSADAAAKQQGGVAPVGPIAAPPGTKTGNYQGGLK